MSAQVYVSIGSNVDRSSNIARVLDLLADEFGVIARSSVYESEAVGFDSAPFYNMVVGFLTDESPRDINAKLHKMEDACGRVRSGGLSARTMDLDLLLYADLVVKERDLSLPRADIDHYAFVLCPLAEIAPDRRHPVSGVRFADLWAGFDDSEHPLTRVAFESITRGRSA